MYSTHKEGKICYYCKIHKNFEKQNLLIHDFGFKNVYIDKLDDIVNKYSNIYHSKIKMKPADETQILTLVRKLMINLKKDHKFKIGDKKYFCKKVTLQIGLKTFL